MEFPISPLTGDSSIKSSKEKRKNLTDQQRVVIVHYLLANSAGGRLKHGDMKAAATFFGVHRATIRRLWKLHSASDTMDGLAGNVASRIKGHSGRKPKVPDEELKARIAAVPAERRMTGRGLSTALGVSNSVIVRLIKSGKLRRHPKKLHYIILHFLKANRTTSSRHFFCLYSLVVLSTAVASPASQYIRTQSSQLVSQDSHLAEERIRPGSVGVYKKIALQLLVERTTASWIWKELVPTSHKLSTARIYLKPLLENQLHEIVNGMGSTSDFFGSPQFQKWDKIATQAFGGDKKVRDRIMYEILLDYYGIEMLFTFLSGGNDLSKTLKIRQRFDAAFLDSLSLRSTSDESETLILWWLNSKKESEGRLACKLFIEKFGRSPLSS
ncbi:hypothetical protein Plhal304r1_c024g0081471 [Plasmopara halstedii]